jgi:hypothetical protein
LRIGQVDGEAGGERLARVGIGGTELVQCRDLRARVRDLLLELLAGERSQLFWLGRGWRGIDSRRVDHGGVRGARVAWARARVDVPCITRVCCGGQCP